MRPRNRLARLFRALSGETQKDFAERTGVDLSLLARYELDQVEPGLDPLARLAEGAGLTLAAGEQVLRLADTLSGPRRRTGAGIEDLGAELPALLAGTYQRLLRLTPPADPPRAEDREHANDLWARLEPLPEDEQLAVVRVAREFQSWALLERVCEESLAASREAGRSASLARLAQEIAARVRGPEEWPTGTDISSLLDSAALRSG
ncbi:MAG TPA: helix-turn-helix transcriptional regulator [Thermoanaerobaculia bacterium]|jgi:transcriptional regulator with XRE-family HTH domain|nr:helix-turn-helix transcriptional regulator [Thermoanaerobaculia bacterium]